MHKLCDEHMDTTRSLYKKGQVTVVLTEIICPKMIELCPRLAEYENCWPVVDITKNYLVRAAGNNRKAEAAAVAEAAEAAAQAAAVEALAKAAADAVAVAEAAKKEKQRTLRPRRGGKA